MGTVEQGTGSRITITDRLLAATILHVIPHSVKPNHVTIVRFLCVPPLVLLLWHHLYFYGMLLFAFAALTDAIDGAMARTRNQITQWGKIADPFADKLLIGTVLIVLMANYVNTLVVWVMVFIELCIVARSLLYIASGRSAQVEANRVGKVKMIMQSVALMSLFVYILSGIPTFLVIAMYTLYLAIAFAIASLVFYVSA